MYVYTYNIYIHIYIYIYTHTHIYIHIHIHIHITAAAAQLLYIYPASEEKKQKRRGKGEEQEILSTHNTYMQTVQHQASAAGDSSRIRAVKRLKRKARTTACHSESSEVSKRDVLRVTALND
jgi:hypothetical protein